MVYALENIGNYWKIEEDYEVKNALNIGEMTCFEFMIMQSALDKD